MPGQQGTNLGSRVGAFLIGNVRFTSTPVILPLPTALRRPEDVSYAVETAASASATAVESGVVGRPIRAESWRSPSKSAPFDASTSQLATAFAIASGRPNPASAAAYSATGIFL